MQNDKYSSSTTTAYKYYGTCERYVYERKPLRITMLSIEAYKVPIP